MPVPVIDPNTLTTALSTLASVSAALAALIGFLGLWKLDWLQREQEAVDRNLRQLVTCRIPPSTVMDFGSHYILFVAKGIIDHPKDSSEERSKPLIKATLDRLNELPGEQGHLQRGLIGFLSVTLGILVLAISGPVYAPTLANRAWVPWAVIAASLLLALGTAYMVVKAHTRRRDYS